MDNWIIVSYATIDTPYMGVLHTYLMPSVKKLGVKSDLRIVPNLGSWQANTGFKSQFIATMLDHHKENIVYCDADAEVLQYPSLFNEIPDLYNFGAHILDREKWYGREQPENRRHELLSGTLFVRNSSESKRIVQEWCDECITHPQIWEQQILDKVLKKNNVSVFPLPLSYCYIKNLPDGRDPIVTCDNPCVVHHQVSRTLKNKIK